jgi:hypothetical protein
VAMAAEIVLPAPDLERDQSVTVRPYARERSSNE